MLLGRLKDVEPEPRRVFDAEDRIHVERIRRDEHNVPILTGKLDDVEISSQSRPMKDIDSSEAELLEHDSLQVNCRELAGFVISFPRIHGFSTSNIDILL
jgi:hypothetical protein